MKLLICILSNLNFTGKGKEKADPQPKPVAQVPATKKDPEPSKPTIYNVKLLVDPTARSFNRVETGMLLEFKIALHSTMSVEGLRALITDTVNAEKRRPNYAHDVLEIIPECVKFEHNGVTYRLIENDDWGFVKTNYGIIEKASTSLILTHQPIIRLTLI